MHTFVCIGDDRRIGVVETGSIELGVRQDNDKVLMIEGKSAEIVVGSEG